MEDYTQLRNNTPTNRSFLYGGSVLGQSSSVYARTNDISINNFHLLPSDQSYDDHHHPLMVKTEGASTIQHAQRFHYPDLSSRSHHQTVQDQDQNHHLQLKESENLSEVEVIKAKITGHPHYSKLLLAYMDCQKVGAPAEVMVRLAAVREEFEARQRASTTGREVSKDPELDKFMEAYYDMLVKYSEELTRPIQEAMEFMRKTEIQLNMLCDSPVRISNEEKSEGVGSSEEEQENSGGVSEMDLRAEDHEELKTHLLRKYSGYLGSLKQELSKKKKKGKLPKDARQKLLHWWDLHYKWPYPSETEKVALAESTGLDQKQINNWFINQRKRHWKPSEDMQFMVMDQGIHQNHATLYMEGHYLAEGPYRMGP